MELGEASDSAAVTSSTTSEAPTCFVCEESTGVLLQGVCKCVGRYIHLECQQKLVRTTTSHATHCAVCLAEYRNVMVTKTPELSRRPESWCQLMMALLIVALLVMSTFYFVAFAQDGDSEFLILALAIASVVLFVVILIVVFRRRLLPLMPLVVHRVHSVVIGMSLVSPP